MFASLAASILSMLTAQPAGAPAPLVAELCNETPARVAFTVSYPAGARSERRRGWLVVEPGACSGGAIGQTTGGLARVHAMSGGYAWPDGGEGESRCAPPASHDDMAASPPCAGGERAFPVEQIALIDRRTHYRLAHTVSCADLAAGDAALCASGRTGPQGFAERVRTFEVCNRDRGAVAMAIASETLDGDIQVQGWTGLEPGQCRTVWRGLASRGLVYAHTRGGGDAAGAGEYPMFCVAPQTPFERVSPGAASETSCGDGLELRPFRPVRFGPNVSLMTLDIEAL